MFSLNMRLNVQLYQGNFPNFQKPVVVGCFSIDGERQFQPNLTQLKYIHIPNRNETVKYDLNHGINTALKKPECVDEKLDNVLQWIRCHREKLNYTVSGQKRIETDFVCYRGLLTTLMCTLYENKEGWIIRATKWQGTIYLCAIATEENQRNREMATPHQKKCMAWGYKFEQYMTKDNVNSVPNTSAPVNECEEFCVTFRTRLNGHSVLYGAEMDGIRSDIEVDSLEMLTHAEFLELKTCRQIESQRQYQNFLRYKMLKWWCQSFLVGIKHVTCGFRDDDGCVNELQDFEVKEMPRIAKGTWDACVCMNFCASFLNFVKTTVQESDNPKSVWKFEFRPGCPEIGVTHIPGLSSFSFLPDWYTIRN